MATFPGTFPSAFPTPRTPDPRQAPALRWGILGPGGIAAKFVAAVQGGTAQRMIAVGSRSADRAADFARRFGIETAYGSYAELVADPSVQAVYIASPHSEHHAHALLAIEAGKSVLIEKPFTRNASEARDVIQAARAAGVLAMEAMWTRYLPGIDVARQLLEDGVLGEIQTVIADHGQYFDFGPEHRLFNPDLAGGALLDLGVYPVSFASMVLGTPDAITAVGEKTTSGVDAQVTAILRTADRHAVITTTMKSRTPTTASISGSVARLEIGGSFYAPASMTLTHRDGRVAHRAAEGLLSNAAMAYEAAHFADLVAEGASESPLLPLHETLSVMATMDEIRRQVGVSYPGE